MSHIILVAMPTSPRKAAHRWEERAYVAEIVAGFEEVAYAEFDRRFGSRVKLQTARPSPTGPTDVLFTYTGDPAALARLRTVTAISLVHHTTVPRPKAILANTLFLALVTDILGVIDAAPAGTFRSLHLAAAGADSTVLVRLANEIAHATRLKASIEAGDLALRVLRPLDGSDGWDVLIRLAPRPLATRPWRMRNLPGALNATVAHAMALLTDPERDDVHLNIGCGSGTLLIERCAAGPAAEVIGCDINADALAIARTNINASPYAARIALHDWDARALPLPDAHVTAITADLPFGNHVGSHTDNRSLYPALVKEAARVARPGARFALLSPEMRLLDETLAASPQWQREQTLRIGLNGVFPRLILLRRAPD